MTITRNDFKPSELASVAAAAALGSWYFRKTEKSLSDRLRRVAVNTWIENIEISRAGVTLNSPGTLFWGLCALYAITGAEDFLLAAKENIPRDPTSFTVANPSGFGMISAFLLPDGGDLSLRRSLREALRVKADNLTSNIDRFFATRDDFSMYSNELLLSDSLSLYAANTVLREPFYKAAAMRNISYVCGVNPLEKCFITGFGRNPVKNPLFPYDLTRGMDVKIEDPPPGIVVPGAKSDIKTDGYLTWQMTPKTPAALCYGDTKTSPTTNSAYLPIGALQLFAAGIN
jgi:endoglucanase